MAACPPLEDIAAFIDGLLPPEERARITEHLARCESCYEVFSGAVHFLEEEDEEEGDSSADDTGGRGVLPFPLAQEKNQEAQETKVRVEPARPSRRASWWLPLAASVALAAVGFFAWQQLSRFPEMSVKTALATVERASGVTDHLYESDRPRGGGEVVVWPGDSSSFMVGVYLIDLGLSVKAGQVESTQDLLQALGMVLDSSTITSDLAQGYTEEYQRFTPDTDVRGLEPKLDALEGGIQERLAGDYFFSFGLWAETGRLASETRTREFFESWRNRRLLAFLLENPPTPGNDLLKSVPEELREIEEVWNRGTFRSQDYDALAESFQKIIKTFERSSSELDAF